MILGRKVEQGEMTGTRMTTLAISLLDLSPFLVFKLEYPSKHFDDT